MTFGPAKFPASLCKRLRAASLAASARTCLSDVPHAPLWWWNSSGSPTGSPCAPALFLPSHYKVFLTISATVVPVSPSQCPGLCHCGRTSLEVSHKSHSSLLLEISHLFSCSQPAHLWDGPASCCRDVSPWKLSGTSQGAGHSHFVDRGVVQQRCACPRSWGPAGQEQRVLCHTGQPALLPFLSQISVFICLFPQIFGKSTGGRAECYQAPAVLFARVSSAGIHHLPFQNPFRNITAPGAAQSCW